MSPATTLITGIAGQDGTYLSELLHDKGYRMTGVVRSLAGSRTDAVRELLPFAELVEGDAAGVHLHHPAEARDRGEVGQSKHITLGERPRAHSVTCRANS
jgi:GDPmannose 4,6-dehydratase